MERSVIRGQPRRPIPDFATLHPAYRNTMPIPDPKTVLTDLWRTAGLDPAALGEIDFTGAEPVQPSSFAIGTAAQATIGAAALAAGEVWRQRTGRRQRVGVAMRHAGAEFRS